MTPRALTPSPPRENKSPSHSSSHISSHPKKRTLLWDWTSVRDSIPLPTIPSDSPICACHNWNTWAPPDLPAHVPFRPMFRTITQLQFPEFEYALSQPYPIMHFLNEPEREGLTPEKACELWFEKIVPLRRERGTKIVGPAAANDHPGTIWLDTFMRLVMAQDPRERPDFLGLHYYGTISTEAIGYLTDRHRKYPNLPVNISEIASISRDGREVEKFSREIAEWADRTEWVAEYGFFGMMQECADAFVSPQAQLMDKKGQLTGLGRWVVGI
ncbi:hypothetical protein V491_01968 [Pseudogymnoascus sp. VKM F-3775]|nr:hypothetical protein V491_01968 [Pseudogymnoascus sp. VKM F-3775]